MKVTDQDVRYVSALAKLELTDDERTRMVRDLNSILDYIGRLNELDTSGVPAMAQVAQGFATLEETERSPTKSAMRNDELYGLRPSLKQSDALANAPQSDRTFFLVPKVIER
jgi:aspartyl-tRNA(Asn)/glutamyl-tRNA(Gln) amidotransferase subunit C